MSTEEKATPFWEKSYRRPGRLDTFGGGKPSPDVVAIASRLTPPAKILDLGCGEGRNALYLANLGHQIRAADISGAGIEKLNLTAQATNVEVHTVVCDMRDYDFSEQLDLIVCQGCLHLIERSEWQLVLQRMMDCTAPGGYHVVGVFTDTVPEPEDQAGLMVGLFQEGELFELYRGWEILEQQARIFEHEHPDGPRHAHAANSLTAIKPI